MAVSRQGGNVTAQQCHGRSWSVEEALSLSLFVTFGTTTRCPLFSTSDPVDLTPLPELVHRQSPGADNVLVRCTLEESIIHPSALGEKATSRNWAGIFSLSACFPFPIAAKASIQAVHFLGPRLASISKSSGNSPPKVTKTTSPHRHLHNTVTCIPSHQHINLEHPIATPQTPIPHILSPSAHQPPSCKSKSACASPPAKAA